MIGAMKEECDSLKEPNIPSKRRMWSARMKRHIENKASARAYKLGRGRDSKGMT